MKTTNKLLPAMLAFTLIFALAFTACDNDPNGSNGNGSTQTPDTPDGWITTLVTDEVLRAVNISRPQFNQIVNAAGANFLGWHFTDTTGIGTTSGVIQMGWTNSNYNNFNALVNTLQNIFGGPASRSDINGLVSAMSPPLSRHFMATFNRSNPNVINLPIGSKSLALIH